MSLLKHVATHDAVYQRVTPDNSVLKELHFESKRMKTGDKWTHDTLLNEYVIVLLGGCFKIQIDQKTWSTEYGRSDVFSGIAHTMYIPRKTIFKLEALKDTDIAVAWVACTDSFKPVMKTPAESSIEIRGGDNVTRQINSLIEPGFPCGRLVCVEVYTPSGNWSSYPPHKHDERVVNHKGVLIEADLEEIYFYKIDRDNGFAIQRIYNDDRTLDELIYAQDNDVVLVPEGYHPVVAGPGYNVYYLNFLVGSDQSLANSPDPSHNWTKDLWSSQDNRLPIVTAKMNYDH